MAKRGRPKKVVNANPLENPVEEFYDEGEDVEQKEPANDMFLISEIANKAKKVQKNTENTEPVIFPAFNSNFDRRSAFLNIFIAMMRNRNRFEDYVVDEAIKATDKLFDKYPN